MPALSLTAQMAFVGALTVKRVPGDERMQTDTSGAIFYRNLSDASATWVAVPNTPRLDNDCMPKDRMALLADPDEPEFLYVAGNARRKIRSAKQLLWWRHSPAQRTPKLL